ncbi:restriction endonuclease [Streptomyces sp. NPDC054797]
MVIQCKHGTAKTTVGSPAIQRLNGTARPVHRGDCVLAVTNGSYSIPAFKFASSQSIDLMARPILERWATWGTPLSEILKLDDKENAQNAA